MILKMFCYKFNERRISHNYFKVFNFTHFEKVVIIWVKCMFKCLEIETTITRLFNVVQYYIKGVRIYNGLGKLTELLTAVSVMFLSCNWAQNVLRARDCLSEVTCIFLFLQVTLYECHSQGEIRLLQSYVDADVSFSYCFLHLLFKTFILISTLKLLKTNSLKLLSHLSLARSVVLVNQGDCISFT